MNFAFTHYNEARIAFRQMLEIAMRFIAERRIAIAIRGERAFCITCTTQRLFTILFAIPLTGIRIGILAWHINASCASFSDIHFAPSAQRRTIIFFRFVSRAVDRGLTTRTGTYECTDNHYNKGTHNNILLTGTDRKPVCDKDYGPIFQPRTNKLPPVMLSEAIPPIP